MKLFFSIILLFALTSTSTLALPSSQVWQPRAAAAAVVAGSSSIQTRGQNQCVDLVNAKSSNGQRLQTTTCSSSSATQTFQFKQASTANKQVLATQNNMCLDVVNGVAANGQPVQVWQCSTTNANQFWSFDSGMLRWNDGAYCLDVANGVNLGFPNGRPMQIWQCDASNVNQQFTASLQSTLNRVTVTSTISSSSSTPSPTASSSSSSSPFDASRKRMLAWGYDNNAAPLMGNGAKIGSYMHWQDNVIPQMPSRVMFVPTYWGPTKKAKWNEVKQTLGSKVPAAVFGFNEPDIASQANMDPSAAAVEYFNEITKTYGNKGTMLISPSVVWNVDGWLVPFMKKCQSLGCNIQAMGYHIYLDLQKDGKGSVDTLITVINQRITYLYNKFQKPIVLGELGLTQAGGGSDAQLRQFMEKSAKLLDNDPRVLAWALSAVFRKGQGWDGYLNSNLAFFDTKGNVNSLGQAYMNTVY